MRANLIIVVLIGLEQMTKMLLAKYTHMIEAVPPAIVITRADMGLTSLIHDWSCGY